MNRSNPAAAATASSSNSSRPLTLPEELEKLDQSITLTLQEIDANFSAAHRTVTQAILPAVARYGRSSDAVWQNTRFWKGFFEASANISLTGYEEPQAQSDELEGDLTQTTVGTTDTGQNDESDMDVTERPRSRATDVVESSELEGSSVAAAATPTGRRVLQDDETSSFAEYPSQYEVLKQEMQSRGPATPKGPDTARAERPSPFKATTEKKRTQPNMDPLLHRVLDKNYRVQATPRTLHKKGAGLVDPAADDVTRQPTRTMNPALDSSPFSPGMEAPQLRAEIFGTPGDKNRKGRVASTPKAARTPGVSVQRPTGKSGFTPAGDGLGGARKTLFTGGKTRDGRDRAEVQERDEVDWRLDSDSDEESAPFGGMSPPKTIQFNMPGNKLLQTPAKEASRRIVDDLLLSARAGADDTSQTDVGAAPTTQAGLDQFDDSPSVIRVTKPGIDEDDQF